MTRIEGCETAELLGKSRKAERSNVEEALNALLEVKQMFLCRAQFMNATSAG